MKETKTELRFFNIMEYEKEQDYLRERHRQGWKLKATYPPGIYRFVRCQPEDVIYQLDYNPDGIKHKDEYVQLFQDCGWEYLFEFAGYSYFCKPAEEAQGDESIFCDDESRLEMVRRVFYGRMLPVLLIFICLILPQFADAVGQDGIASPFFILILILLALFLLVFCQFAWQYRRFSQGIRK